MASITPYMNLTKWDSLNDPFSHAQLAANIDFIDGHDHSEGKGKKIPGDGIEALAIRSFHLSDGVLSTEKIADSAVTAPKIATGAITSSQISSSAAIPDTKLASPPNGIYRTMFDNILVVTDGTASGTTYINQVAGVALASGGSSSVPTPVFYFDDADYAIAGKTTKLRLRVVANTNATASAVTTTVGLYPVTAVAGGADVESTTAGTVVSGSTVAFASPSASTRNQGNSGNFDVPADGYYTFGFTVSGTPTADSRVALTALLQVTHV